MLSAPAISFLVCTRNRAEVARECVQRLLSSPRQDFEVVVRDNCSTDNTLELLRAIRDPRLRLYQAPENQGTVSFFEIPKLATGDIVTWLSDEDDFQFEHLDFVLGKFAQDPGCRVLFGSIVVGADRRVIYAEQTIHEPVGACLTALSFSGCGGLFVRRSALPSAHAFAVRSLDDAYALWNFYPVGFFASRCVAESLTTTSRIVAVQARHAGTTNNWSRPGPLGSVHAPHYYPESVFDRLASNLVNVYLKSFPMRVKIGVALQLIRHFHLQSAWFSDPSAHELLRENYSGETVERFLDHVRALRLGHPLGRLMWVYGRTLMLPARFLKMLSRWRQVGAT